MYDSAQNQIDLIAHESGLLSVIKPARTAEKQAKIDAMNARYLEANKNFAAEQARFEAEFEAE